MFDPDKETDKSLTQKAKLFEENGADLFFLGSSQPLETNIDKKASAIKAGSVLPLVIFPGAPEQITKYADGILFISLLSGRNPDYLIENHVQAAPILKKINLPTIPCGYILIESGLETSVQKISKTKPLLSDDIEKVVAHALAGEMLGMKYIYLEAGSGAKKHVPAELVKAVKSELTIPLIVGGGIRDKETATKIREAGADFIVVGNLFEKNLSKDEIVEFIKAVKGF